MTYSVSVKKDVIKAIAHLGPPYRERVADVLRSLAADPRPHGCLPLRGLSDTWRIRLGDIRIVYEIHDNRLSVYVVRVAHRSEVYRKL